MDSIVYTDLNPSEDYKSSVLAALKPDMILDIASRALSFWT
jgi:E3 ubiquitin-protein ligase CCNP1IP1